MGLVWSDEEREEIVALVSAREREVLALLARGWSVKEIAAEWCVSWSMVYSLRGRVMETLGVRTNAGLVVMGLILGLIEFPRPEEMRGWDGKVE